MATCVKVSYKTRVEARRAAQRKVWRKGQKKSSHLLPYQCDACGQFHLTSKAQR